MFGARLQKQNQVSTSRDSETIGKTKEPMPQQKGTRGVTQSQPYKLTKHTGSMASKQVSIDLLGPRLPGKALNSMQRGAIIALKSRRDSNSIMVRLFNF